MSIADPTKIKQQSLRMEQQYWDMLNLLCAHDKRKQGPETENLIKVAFKRAGLELPTRDKKN